LCSCPDAFISLQACAIEVIGVSGSLPIFGVGTAAFAASDALGNVATVLLHNCLLSQGGSFNLLSVSQLQMSRSNSVDFSPDAPRLNLQSRGGKVFVIPLQLSDGLFSVIFHPLSVNDIRYADNPQFALTAPGSYVPPTALAARPNSLDPVLPNWERRLIVAPSASRRIMAFPSREGPDFNTNLQNFCQRFHAPLSIPPARRTYDKDNPIHMSDLSVRFMGTSQEKLQRTLQLNRGLGPVTGRVPTLNFPQGKFRQGKTPKVSKNKVHHLHRASICEVVFTDTFESGDHKYAYGQAFVDYRSRWGDIIPIRSRTQVGWAFTEFICRNFAPLILVRDNIAENTGGALMEECRTRGIQSAFICPHTPQQDQAENYLGRITAMASYAMVYSGAPLFFWPWAVLAAVFIDKISATFYSREQVWSTPYTLVMGEPFPDASIVVPFGCGALILLDQDDREKFQSRCALMVFVHYAVSHPLYTYAFYSPRTKRILFRQDAIFLVTHFPMRIAREASGLDPQGEPFVPFRSPLGISDPTDDLSFQRWACGDPLPPYDDHVLGFPLTDSPEIQRTTTASPPSDWPRRFPFHEAFGPRSTVAVPVAPPYPDGSDTGPFIGDRAISQDEIENINYSTDMSREDASTSELLSVDISLATKDGDMSRGMGNLLRQPNARARVSRGRAPNLGPSLLPSTPEVHVSSPLVSQARCPSPPLARSTRVLRDRSKRAIPSDVQLPVTKRLVGDRWIFEPVPNPPSLLMASSTVVIEDLTADPNDEPDMTLEDQAMWSKLVKAADKFEAAAILQPSATPTVHDSVDFALVPRAAWMLQDDPRSDAEADAEWRHTTNAVFGPPTSAREFDDGVPRTPTMASMSCFLHAVGTLPHAQFDTAAAFLDPQAVSAPPELPPGKIYRIPLTPMPPVHLNSKTMRRILAMRETIFKYGIYLPKTDRDADTSPESARWRSGRQLEWLRLKAVQAFEYDWTVDRMLVEFPDYKVADIGRLFYIYDYKFSGEHRVRLVFDGSRQSSATYTSTYSPTVRSESIRIFHVFSVEMQWDISQFDVPQAFLQSKIDHTIFVYPPRSHVERPNQILKLRLALYGAKQSSALFYQLLNAFLLTLGFVSSTFDPCFYKRTDALIIVHVDDMRVSATPAVLTAIHTALFDRFKITTSDGSRFLGMDVVYNREEGFLTMGMPTYIQATLDRFVSFDTARGVPYREIVGCLLWIVLCVHGPELFRVKDLARRSNHPSLLDYQDALKVLKRLYKRRTKTILFQRGSADLEVPPLQTRPVSTVASLDTPVTLLSSVASSALPSETTPVPSTAHDCFPSAPDITDIPEVFLPVNPRFRLVNYTDAAFAVGEMKFSISGFTIYLNCTPIMWGSLTQTTHADSSCASEFVAASVCCKYINHVENMIRFLGFTCPKPYRLYTDSQASLQIATNTLRMGQIRHIAIRYHLVRGMVAKGDVEFIFCVTEEMIADLFTKILSGSTFDRLSTRFYFIGSY
jgi:hypothetical protein